MVVLFSRRMLFVFVFGLLILFRRMRRVIRWMVIVLLLRMVCSLVWGRLLCRFGRWFLMFLWMFLVVLSLLVVLILLWCRVRVR